MTDAVLLSDPGSSAPFERIPPGEPERLEAARAAIERSELGFKPIAPRAATQEELLRVHTPDFVHWLQTLSGEQGYLDADTYVGPESIAVAQLAAGGTIAMLDAMLDGP